MTEDEVGQCSVCAQPATFVDDRPGANPVGFCHLHLPSPLFSMREQLTKKDKPKKAPKGMATGVGKPRRVDAKDELE